MTHLATHYLSKNHIWSGLQKQDMLAWAYSDRKTNNIIFSDMYLFNALTNIWVEIPLTISTPHSKF